MPTAKRVPAPAQNPTSHAPRTPWRRYASTAALALTAAAALVCQQGQAHDWASPAPLPDGAQRRPTPRPGHDATWQGLMWAGVEQGRPAAPKARDCKRAPQLFEVAGPQGFDRRQHLHGETARMAAPMSAPLAARAAADSAVAAAPPLPAAPATTTAVPPAGKPAARVAEAAAPSAAPLHQPVLPVQPGMPAPARARPADEAVTAGVVDDNADFGDYQAYRRRHTNLQRQELDISQRVLLDVRDERGQPVPDALVQVSAEGQAVPIWARTDAAGRAWLMPQGDALAPRYEVQVSKAGRSTRVAWTRGQKDRLQARLEGVAATPAQLDVVFLIDATGSMGDEIDKLKRSMRAVAEQIAKLPSQPDLCFGLVAYRDRGDEFFVRGADLSNDLSGFQKVLADLRANGGGDYPEALNEALHTAVHRISWRGEGTARLVVLVADAPPHLDYGAPYYNQDLRAALAQGIKVLSVGASGLDPQGEYIFRQFAQFTGGRFVFLTYDQARNPASGPGRETVHEVSNYSVETLDKLLVRLVSEEMAHWPR